MKVSNDGKFCPVHVIAILPKRTPVVQSYSVSQSGLEQNMLEFDINDPIYTML